MNPRAPARTHFTPPFMYDHAEPMQAPNIAKFGRQILWSLKTLRSAGVPSLGGHLHTGNVLVSELAFPMSIGILGACVLHEVNDF